MIYFMSFLFLFAVLYALFSGCKDLFHDKGEIKCLTKKI